MRVLNTEQMREADRRTIEDIGIPSIVLMENAGRQAVAAMEAAFDDLATSRVGVLCGRGNNGGDGFVVARTLVQRGVDTAVFLLGSVAEVRGDARTNLEVLGRIGLTVVEITNAQEWELHFSELSDCELHRRRDPRHRLPRPAHRAARDRRRRRERPRRADRRDRSADRPVGRQRRRSTGRRSRRR